jgi:hypothetical protein
VAGSSEKSVLIYQTTAKCHKGEDHILVFIFAKPLNIILRNFKPCRLFNGPVTKQYMAANGWMISNKMHNMWNEAVVA